MGDSYHIKQQFLCKNYCNYLIELFKNNQNLTIVHEMTTLINLHDFMHLDPIKKLYGMISKHCIDNLSSDAFINYMQVVEWKSGSSQGEHFDFDFHPYTSIIYLSDDFDDGETFVGNEKIKPESGKILSFAGNKTPHGVLEVKNGTRYTVPIWYKEGKF